MKILYLGCHEVLEFDEVRMLHELGHQVFSTAAHIFAGRKKEWSLRPSLSCLNYEAEDLAAFHSLTRPPLSGHPLLTREFVGRFDVVIIMHSPEVIECNWEALRHGRVAWRTIGQSFEGLEMRLSRYRERGLKVIRCSPMERLIPGYMGEDAVIRFYKDPDDYGPWNGRERAVITVAQSMPRRSQVCSFDIFVEVLNGLPHKLLGPDNKGAGKAWRGVLSYDALRAAYTDHRAFFFTGTKPASYTLTFVEAWMSGIPIVAIGSRLGDAHPMLPGHHLYEVPRLIDNEVNGFVSDSPEVLKKYLTSLLQDEATARAVSAAGRQESIRIFGKEIIAQQWKQFLKDVC